MLRNIDQTLEYYRKLADCPSGYPGEILEPRLKPLASVPRGLGLPQSYIDFVQKFKVENVSVGFLELEPLPAESIFEGLRLLNGDRRSPYVDGKFVHVANYEADLVLLLKGDDFHADGRVFFRDISTGFFPEPICLANNFEDFVVAVANLHKLCLDDQVSQSEPFSKIVRIICPALPNDGLKCWNEIREMCS